MIKHKPIFKIKQTEKVLSEEEGVEVKYVCTSEIPTRTEELPIYWDVFYRSNPHPTFGNNYFGLRHTLLDDKIIITNADYMEGVEIPTLKDSEGDEHYSRHVHDYVTVDEGNFFIDGGRRYTRTNAKELTTYIIKGGEWVLQT